MEGFSIKNTISNPEFKSWSSSDSQLKVKDKNSISSSDAPVVSFQDMLKNAINETNNLQIIADKKMQELAVGKSDNIPEVMLAAEKADISIKLMLQVRNKIIDAYQEIMKMQV